VSMATLPSCSCQCFISMCDFSIDEQINDDDDDDDDDDDEAACRKDAFDGS